MMPRNGYGNSANHLEHRRNQLGLEPAWLARRARLPLDTVQKVLDGSDSSPDDVRALVAKALGGDEDPETFRVRTARAKAVRLVQLVQGNMSLEGQGLRRETLFQMIEETVGDLLASPRHLWG